MRSNSGDIDQLVLVTQTTLLSCATTILGIGKVDVGIGKVDESDADELGFAPILVE